MSVIRINKTNNFTVMSNYHFKEKGMSLKAKGLLSLMLSLPDDWDYSIMGLVKLSKDGKDSVMSALAELEKFGYLSRTRLQNDKGQFAGVEYNIYEEPQPQNPNAEKQNEDKSNEGKQDAENRTQLNTNPLNNLKNELHNILNTKDHHLLELYEEYIEMRNNINSPLTKTGLAKLIDRCERLSKSNIKIQKVLLETAIINNWKNVYLPREDELQSISNEMVDDFKNLLGLE